MFSIKQNDFGHIELYLHDDCPFDIHYVSQMFIRTHDEGNGGEYLVRDKYHSTIAFF